MKISAIKNLADKTKGVEACGEITNIFKKETKINSKDNTPFDVQNFIFKDDTGTIKISAFDRFVPDSLIGKKITLTGCTVKTYMDKDKVWQRTLNMSKTTSGIFGDDGQEIVDIPPVPSTPDAQPETPFDDAQGYVNETPTVVEVPMPQTAEKPFVVTLAEELIVSMERTVNLGDYENVKIRSEFKIPVIPASDLAIVHKDAVIDLEALNKAAIAEHYNKQV